MKRRKKAITLLEVFIGLGLISILIGSLLTYIRHSAALNHKIQKAEREVLSRAKLQNRLIQIFSNLTSQGDSGSNFYTAQEEDLLKLCFYFYNGIDPEKAFSGTVKGELFLEKGRLILERTAIQEKNPPKRREVLFHNVNSWHLEFFEDFSPLPKKEWQNDNTKLPAVFKMVLSCKEGEFVFPFFLLDQEFEGLTYEGKAL